MTHERTAYAGCPLCGSAAKDVVKTASCAGHVLYKPELPPEIHWVACPNCGHIYTDGYFEGRALECLLSGAQQTQTPGFNVEHGRNMAADMVERVIAQRTPLGMFGGRWLDVGFGAGALLTTAAEYGFDVTGIDARPEPVRILRELGYDVHKTTFETFETDGVFDVVSMADVLEHMPFPHAALEKARVLLRPPGLLFVSMPNKDAFAWQALDIAGENPYWAEIEHYHNFGRERLYRLLREVGFEPVSYGVSRRYRVCMEVVARRCG